MDPTKIETELGWEPEYTFETGIRKTIAWYLENKAWYEHILSGEFQQYYADMYKERQ